MHKHAHPKPPSADKLMMELPRAAKEIISLTDWRWRSQLKRAPRGDGHAVMTLPGFGGGDGCMAIMRQYLNSLGYQAHPWGLGANLTKDKAQSLDEVLEFCAKMESDIVLRIERIANETDEKVSLIGWSMGGIYANSIAQTHPDLVRQIITLGSPIGDPRGTSVWNIMKTVLRGKIPDHLQNVDGWVARRDQLGERKVRTSILYSHHDGAVSRGSAVIDDHDMVENIHVPSSHVGFAHNPLVYWVIADRLSQDIDDWKGFHENEHPRKVRKSLVGL
jgi:pimeloyl-ACP methyl ester carboxylesterase